MKLTHFLADFTQDEPLRLRLWDVFRRAEAEARRFCEPGAVFAEVSEVRYRPEGALWEEHGGRAVIGLVPQADDLGAVSHEVFHSVFHGSRFGGPGEAADDAWGEAFCEAFRYGMEKALQSDNDPPSEWFSYMTELCEARFEELVGNLQENCRQNGLNEGQYRQELWLLQRYHYPCSSIVRQCGGGSLDALRAFWQFLHEAKADKPGQPFLNEFFHYDMDQGRPTP